MRRWIAVLGLVAGVSACMAQQDQGAPKQLGPECSAAGLQSLVGGAESQLAAVDLKPPVRMLRPGMAMTMDYSPSRLNVEIDAKGKIVRIFCG